jgi:hypothetical protein
VNDPVRDNGPEAQRLRRNGRPFFIVDAPLQQHIFARHYARDIVPGR